MPDEMPDEMPEPKHPITTEEFLTSLDRGNPQFEEVELVFSVICGDRIMGIYKKDASLYEMVHGRLGPFRLPIIDKPLQVVIEARGGHQSLTGALFAYHAAAQGEDPSLYHERTWGERYCRRGFGYYFTGAWGNARSVIIWEHVYKPDRYDKDLLLSFGIKY